MKNQSEIGRQIPADAILGEMPYDHERYHHGSRNLGGISFNICLTSYHRSDFVPFALRRRGSLNGEENLGGHSNSSKLSIFSLERISSKPLWLKGVVTYNGARTLRRTKADGRSRTAPESSPVRRWRGGFGEWLLWVF